MSAVIKRVTASPYTQDTFLTTATPPVWGAVGSAKTYASPYLALVDAVSVRDYQTGYPDIETTDKIVIWDRTPGTEYAVPHMSLFGG